MTVAATPEVRDISRNGLLFCKWIGVIAMTADHIDKYLLAERVPALFAIGRMAFPLFAAVLGAHLALCHRDAMARRRTMGRLAVVSGIAQVPYIGLGPVVLGWWPLNAMASLLCLAAIVHMLERRDWRGYCAAAALLVVGGALVEFWWPGLLVGVGAWLVMRAPGLRVIAFVVLGLGFLGLGWINGNQWALLALPVLAVAGWAPRTPRAKWGFYAYYPLHLAVLWALRAGA